MIFGQETVCELQPCNIPNTKLSVTRRHLRVHFLEPIAPNTFRLTYDRTSSKLFQKCVRVVDLLCTASAPCFAQNDVGGFFSDHIDRARNKKTGYAGKHRGIDDAQPLHPVDLEIAAQDAALGLKADRTAA